MHNQAGLPHESENNSGHLVESLVNSSLVKYLCVQSYPTPLLAECQVKRQQCGIYVMGNISLVV